MQQGGQRIQARIAARGQGAVERFARLSTLVSTAQKHHQSLPMPSYATLRDTLLPKLLSGELRVPL